MGKKILINNAGLALTSGGKALFTSDTMAVTTTWTGSQASYDALSSKSRDTLYLIEGSNNTYIKAYLGTKPLCFFSGTPDTITGYTTLTFFSEMGGKIVALVRDGKVEQRNLPKGYTELEYIEGDGTAYIDLGFKLTQDDNIEVDFALTTSQASKYIFGNRGNDASLNNISLFLASTANKSVADFNNSDYSLYRAGPSNALTTGVKYSAVLNKNKRGIYNGATTIVENTTVCADTIETAGNAAIFGGFYQNNAIYTANNFQGRIYRVTIVGKHDLRPAKNSSDVVGMYDLVSGQFFANSGTGSFTAGPDAVPTPSTPMGIWTNNGALRYGALGTNLFDPSASAILLNYYRNASTGVLTQSNPNFISAGYIPVKPNTSYVLVGRRKSDNTISAWNRIYWFDANKEFISTCSYTQNTATVATSPANAAYAQYGINYNNSPTNVLTQAEVDNYNYTFCEGTAEPAAFVPYVGGIYAEGTPEVITDADGNTASVVNLLGVGDYADTQEIISGLLTHKIGVLVLDGVTTGKKFNDVWNATYKRCNLAVSDMLSSASSVADALCTHFGYSSSVYSAPVNDGFCTHNGTAYFSFVEDADINSSADANAKLAAQYAAGTPVIVIYLLATPTTESATAQEMTEVVGSNTVEITANVSDPKMTITYID